jgi:hypothetical protein
MADSSRRSGTSVNSVWLLLFLKNDTSIVARKQNAELYRVSIPFE